jgi:predicted small secreted protein
MTRLVSQAHSNTMREGVADDGTLAINSRGIFMARLIALLLIAGTAVLAGCNTMAGAGQDISKGGNAITNSADKHAD